MALSPLFPFSAGGVLLVILLGLAFVVFDIVMLVDAVRRPESGFNPPQSRVWWIIALSVGILITWLGLAASIAYYFVVRRPANQGTAPPRTTGTITPIARRSPGRACRNCGEPLGTHARFCNHCGTAADLED